MPIRQLDEDDFLDEIESRNIKQVTGDKGRFHRIGKIAYEYTTHGISASFKDLKKLRKRVIEIIPVCDTIVWRYKPEVSLVHENGEVRFYLRAIFIQNGKQVLGLFPKKEGENCVRI